MHPVPHRWRASLPEARRALRTPVRGTRALSWGLRCQKSRCRHLRSTVSCTGQLLPHFAQGKCAPRSKSSRSRSSRPATSNSLSTTFQPGPSPSAFVKRTFESISDPCAPSQPEAPASRVQPQASPNPVPPERLHGERRGVWGRAAPIKPVRQTHSK